MRFCAYIQWPIRILVEIRMTKGRELDLQPNLAGPHRWLGKVLIPQIFLSVINQSFHLRLSHGAVNRPRFRRGPSHEKQRASKQIRFYAVRPTSFNLAGLRD